MKEYHLSKSKYTKFCQCPKLLWLDKYRPELIKQDPTLQRRFDEGTEVGKLAQKLFGESRDVTVEKDGGLDLSAMISATEEELKKGTDTICEAAFSAENCYCAVDLLHKEGDGYAIYEVKSSTKVSEVYLWDIAYQKWVLEKAGVNVTGTYLVHINSSYVRHGEIDVHKFFKIVDVAEQIKPYYPLVGHNVEKAQGYLSAQEEPEIAFGTHCKKPYECAFWEYCSREVPSPSIFDLYNMHFDRACKYYYDGVVTYADAINQGMKLSDKQERINHVKI